MHHFGNRPPTAARATLASRFLGSACAVLAVCATVDRATSQERELRPRNAYSVDLAGYRGTAYFSDEPGGYRLVATLADEAGAPIRFETMLVAPGHSVAISVPGAVGQPAQQITFTRRDRAVNVARDGARGY